MTLTVTQAVEFVVALADQGQARYERAAGRLSARIALEHRLGLTEQASMLRCFNYLPNEPEKARATLLSWARYRRRRRG